MLSAEYLRPRPAMFAAKAAIGVMTFAFALFAVAMEGTYGRESCPITVTQTNGYTVKFNLTAVSKRDANGKMYLTGTAANKYKSGKRWATGRVTQAYVTYTNFFATVEWSPNSHGQYLGRISSGNLLGHTWDLKHPQNQAEFRSVGPGLICIGGIPRHQ